MLQARVGFVRDWRTKRYLTYQDFRLQYYISQGRMRFKTHIPLQQRSANNPGLIVYWCIHVYIHTDRTGRRAYILHDVKHQKCKQYT